MTTQPKQANTNYNNQIYSTIPRNQITNTNSNSNMNRYSQQTISSFSKTKKINNNSNNVISSFIMKSKLNYYLLLGILFIGFVFFYKTFESNINNTTNTNNNNNNINTIDNTSLSSNRYYFYLSILLLYASLLIYFIIDEVVFLFELSKKAYFTILWYFNNFFHKEIEKKEKYDEKTVEDIIEHTNLNRIEAIYQEKVTKSQNKAFELKSRLKGESKIINPEFISNNKSSYNNNLGNQSNFDNKNFSNYNIGVLDGIKNKHFLINTYTPVNYTSNVNSTYNKSQYTNIDSNNINYNSSINYDNINTNIISYEEIKFKQLDILKKLLSQISKSGEYKTTLEPVSLSINNSKNSIMNNEESQINNLQKHLDEINFSRSLSSCCNNLKFLITTRILPNMIDYHYGNYNSLNKSLSKIGISFSDTIENCVFETKQVELLLKKHLNNNRIFKHSFNNNINKYNYDVRNTIGFVNDTNNNNFNSINGDNSGSGSFNIDLFWGDNLSINLLIKELKIKEQERNIFLNKIKENRSSLYKSSTDLNSNTIINPYSNSNNNTNTNHTSYTIKSNKTNIFESKKQNMSIFSDYSATLPNQTTNNLSINSNNGIRYNPLTSSNLFSSLQISEEEQETIKNIIVLLEERKEINDILLGSYNYQIRKSTKAMITLDYVVQRLDELNQSKLMKFKFNSGGKYKSNDWISFFPTDSMIICNLFLENMKKLVTSSNSNIIQNNNELDDNYHFNSRMNDVVYDYLICFPLSVNLSSNNGLFVYKQFDANIETYFSVIYKNKCIELLSVRS